MSNILVDAIEEILQAEQETTEAVSAPKLLNQVSQFIARYLQCSEHHRTVLTLWLLHTYCLEAAHVTPYLYIHSASKQSGKTLCLQLLDLLSDRAALTCGFTVSLLTRRLDASISALLLDDCHATLGTRARSKSPAMQAILAGGFQAGLGYSGEQYRERTTFRPKAFAGMGGLPEALSDRSIPIFLEPLHPESKTQRLRIFQVREETQLLRSQLNAWSRGHLDTMKEQPPYEEKDFPDGITPRRRDLIEPLLQLADYVGGRWPKRIREALAAIFQEEAAREMQPSLQLLADIHDCFSYHAYPARLSTSALLDWMHSLPARPWDIDGSMSAMRLGRLLSAFEIHPRYQRFKSEKAARGYQLESFRQLWQKHLNIRLPEQAEESPSRNAREVDGLDARSRKLEADSSQIANNGAACSMLRPAEDAGSGDASDSQAVAGTDFIAQQKAKLKAINQRIAEANARLQAYREARNQSATASTGGIAAL